MHRWIGCCPCSRGCQTAHWPVHKARCKELCKAKTAAAAASGAAGPSS